MNDLIKNNMELIGEKVIKPMYDDGSFPLTVADEIAKRISQPTASEFLSKAKTICAIDDLKSVEDTAFLIIDYLMGMGNALSESDLIQAVMDYRLEEAE